MKVMHRFKVQARVYSSEETPLTFGENKIPSRPAHSIKIETLLVFLGYGSEDNVGRMCASLFRV